MKIILDELKNRAIVFYNTRFYSKIILGFETLGVIFFIYHYDLVALIFVLILLFADGGAYLYGKFHNRNNDDYYTEYEDLSDQL